MNGKKGVRKAFLNEFTQFDLNQSKFNVTSKYKIKNNEKMLKTHIKKSKYFCIKNITLYT